jgi:hypothetical protein
MSVTYFQENDADRRGVPAHPALASLEHHWQSLRSGQTAPARADIDPCAIDKALSWTFLLHRVAPGVARIRVAGQDLHDILRMDPRGMPISAFFDADDRSTLSVHVESVFSDPALIMIPLHRPAALLRPSVQGALLLMPLTDHLGEVTRAIGALVTDRSLGQRRRVQINGHLPMRYEPLSMFARQESIQQKGPSALRPALRLVVNNG